MKITMVEIEATAEELKSSRTVSDAFTMACGRIADMLCGYDTAVSEEDKEGSEE